MRETGQISGRSHSQLTHEPVFVTGTFLCLSFTAKLEANLVLQRAFCGGVLLNRGRPEGQWAAQHCS